MYYFNNILVAASVVCGDDFCPHGDDRWLEKFVEMVVGQRRCWQIVILFVKEARTFSINYRFNILHSILHVFRYGTIQTKLTLRLQPDMLTKNVQIIMGNNKFKKLLSTTQIHRC